MRLSLTVEAVVGIKRSFCLLVQELVYMYNKYHAETNMEFFNK